MLGPQGSSIDRTTPFPALVPALSTLRYAYPALVFSYYIFSTAIAVCTLRTKSPKGQSFRRSDVQSILLFGVLTYLVQLSSLFIQSLLAGAFLFQQDDVVSLLSCILVFGVELVGLLDSQDPAWFPYVGSYLLALLFEPAIEVLAVLNRPNGALTNAQVLEISTVATRCASFILVLGLFFGLPYGKSRAKGVDAEQQPLLRKDTPPGVNSEADGEERTATGYGSATDSSKDASQSNGETPESPWERRERLANEQMEKRLKEKGNWLAYAKSFLVFFPYIWPVNNRELQIRAVLVGFCLLGMNLVNILIPRQLGIVMDSLSKANGENPWIQVMLFAVLKLVASDAGLSLLRQWLWVPVEYYSFDAMSTAAYSHVLNLSSDFHDTRSSSDTMMAIQSGQSVSNILESVCFRAIPMLVDMGVAFVYLSVTFGPYEGLITIATATVFLYIATKMISSLKSARRSEVSAFFEEHYVRQAGIQGWTTVACFNQIGHEEQRYSTAVKNRVAKSQSVFVKYIVAYAFQYLVLLSGLLAGLFLAVYQITDGSATPGQFIMLLTYWSQLVAPLSFFAGMGKSISRDLIHAEQLLEIMQTKPSVVNKEGAPPLQLTGGRVRFSHVDFSYNQKKAILDDVDFSVPPGATVAIVGPTGAGKSTILKLLDRFYDVSSGSIEIDGQDIRDVDLGSLRAQVGVVPQAPILFDDTIMNNVRYAKLTATDDEVFEACKAASIHDQITGFTEGYNTRVGERGIKLSGGELQRVAIARAILKRPHLVLLDEATSAVDTATEQKIQEALHTLCDGRTTFVVAHRLSTIVNADRIIVVDNGKVIEEGHHEDLIFKNGKYAELWSQQAFVKLKDRTNSEDDSTGTSAESPDPSDILTSEMIKVANGKTVDTTSDSSAGPQDEEAAKATATNPGAETPAGHKKEGSRLNPDAPTFTPRSVAAALSTSASPTKQATSGDAALDIGQSLAGRARKPHARGGMSATLSGGTSTSSSRPRLGGYVARTQEQPTETSQDTSSMAGKNASGGYQGTGLKYPRYSRRVQSRSEPSRRGNASDD